ncbi:type I restriction endonuclease [Methylophaga sp. SB9B]|uniref:type I restriction endonuclease n=1 Tax=Methylophaga sp. SB9B TaxID=2570356 RepID=UPI001B3C17D6|nr:type I restriction endonuclease [Methylophaga sp. SB9B]
MTGTNPQTSRSGEDVKQTPAEYDVANNGFEIGLPADFNIQYAIDEKLFWRFLEQTQAPQLERLKKNSPIDWQRKFLDRFDRLIKKHGILQLLKKGLSVDDAHFDLMYPAPLASSSQSIKNNFETNIFSCTRQVRYSLANPLQEIDMVLFLNGISLITLELKNAWTGQTARYHGQKQYRDDRDAKQPLLNFGRCLVHMALDTDEVYMTTKLAGKSTFFCPSIKATTSVREIRPILKVTKQPIYGKKYLPS